jgi:hypothetical protein
VGKPAGVGPSPWKVPQINRETSALGFVVFVFVFFSSRLLLRFKRFVWHNGDQDGLLD